MAQQANNNLLLFLSGDVMTGRGIDQALPHSTPPILYESYVKDARDYIRFAEKGNGPLNLPLSHSYIWGDSLSVWEEINPDLKIINLETSITDGGEPWKGKGIHYRMHPKNIALFTTAKIDFITLANNHTLDWGYSGLMESMATLNQAGLAFGGAGKDLASASTPVVFNTPKGRVIILSYGSTSSGIPRAWAATPKRAGLNLAADLGHRTIMQIKMQIDNLKKPGDIVVFSVHWGSNWGWSVPEEQRTFAHKLIDQAGVDLVHGHSSHHPRGIEVYQGKLLLYGAGDLINDYEGISGHENYRGDLTLMYFPEINPTNGKLESLKMVPMQIKNLQLSHASMQDARWLASTLSRAGESFGNRMELQEDGNIILKW